MKSNALSANLRLLMESRHNLTEAKLAKELDMPQATLNRLIGGYSPNPTVSTLMPIAKYFGVSLDQLLGIETIPDSALDEMQLGFKRTQFKKIPLIKINEAHSWPHFIKSLSQSNWADWAMTDQEVSDMAYALKIESNSLPMPYLFHSTHIVDPQADFNDGDVVIMYSNHNRTTQIKKIYVEGSQKWLLSLKEGIAAEPFDDSWNYCGVVRQHIINTASK
jgi:SOS-response transcriptional repressor LexA